MGLLCSSPGVQVSRTPLSVWSVISRSAGGSGLSVNATTGPRIKTEKVASVNRLNRSQKKKIIPVNEMHTQRDMLKNNNKHHPCKSYSNNGKWWDG